MEQENKKKNCGKIILKIIGLLISLPAAISSYIGFRSSLTMFWHTVLIYSPLFLILIIGFFFIFLYKSIKWIQFSIILKNLWWIIIPLVIITIVLPLSSIKTTKKYYDSFETIETLQNENSEITTKLTECCNELEDVTSEKEECEIDCGLKNTQSETPDGSSTTSPSIEVTPSPGDTQILNYPYIRIGVFDLGDEYLKTENIDFLNDLGFSTEIISFNISIDALKDFDVVYFSSGWCSQISFINDNVFTKKMDSYRDYGGGILLGDPEPSGNEKCDIEFIPFTFSYEELNQVPSYEAYVPCRYNHKCSVHWIVNDISDEDLPIPDTKLVIPQAEGGFYVIVRQEISYNPSLVISLRTNGYWALLPGAEPSSNTQIIDSELMENIILWLAQERPFDGEAEWYD